MADCIFCRIARGEAPATIVYQDEHLVAFKDIAPIAPFHVQVIPRRHVASLAEVEDVDLLGRLVVAAAKVARDAGYAQRGFRVLTNVGPDAGQTVAHLHFWVLAGRRL